MVCQNPSNRTSMTPQALLTHFDQGSLWPKPLTADGQPDLAAAYGLAMEVRALRMARREIPLGFKVGFTNRTIWPRYGVYAPIWGCVWDTSLRYADAHGQCEVSLAHTCQPRLEPEIAFGMRATPVPQANLQQLFDAIDWMAPAFEVVQSHLPDWKFQAADTVADGGLHAHLRIGKKTPVQQLGVNAAALDTLLAQASVTLIRNGNPVEDGQGANVLGSPMRALLNFLEALRACPGAPDLVAGDVVTTGTWTDAWPMAPGQQWNARFSLPGFQLGLRCTE
jgi:2-keto-4-pentenoate hydratase